VSARAEPLDVRRRAVSIWAAALAVTGVAGVALHVWTYRAEMGTPDSDEAIVGLMVRHLVHQGELTAFYWGQAYGGSQEALLTAPLFLIAGSSWLALRLVPIALHVVACMLVWRVGRRTIGEPAATVAGALFWLWPAFDVYQLTHQYDFYASDVVYCALLLLLGLRVVERPDRLRVATFGLVLGLAFWQTAQIVPVAVPLIAWTIWKQPRSLRHAWLAVPLSVLGALPWIVWNAQHGWHSLEQHDYGDYAHSLRLLFSPSLPMMLGLRAPYSARVLIPPTALTYLIYAALLAVFAYAAIGTRRQTRSLLYLVAAAFPFIYAISPKTVLALGIPRYLTVLTPLLALLVAQVATTRPRGLAVLAIACLVSVVTLQRIDVWFRAPPSPTNNAKGAGPRHAVHWVPRDLGRLTSTLEALQLRHVYADYWLAYRLDFDTRERLVATESRFMHLRYEHGQAIPVGDAAPRFREYQREVQRARHGFVFYGQIVGSIPIVASLERHGYRRHMVGTYVVYAPPPGVPTS
jgi:Dolichyl-phosphate-mannose-protein mannosyltransferase